MTELFDLTTNYEVIYKKYESLSKKSKSLISIEDVKNLFSKGFIDENLDIVLKSTLYGDNIDIFQDMYEKYKDLYEKYHKCENPLITFVSPNQLKQIKNKTWNNFFNELYLSYDVIKAEIHNLENPSINIKEIEYNIKDFIELYIENKNGMIKYFLLSKEVSLEIKVKMYKIIYADYKEKYSKCGQNIIAFLFEYKFNNKKFIENTLNTLNKIKGKDNKDIIKRFIKKYISESFKNSFKFYTKTLKLTDNIVNDIYIYINNKFKKENCTIFRFLFYIVHEEFILGYEEDKKYLCDYFKESFHKNNYNEIKKLIDNNKLTYFILPFSSFYNDKLISNLIDSIHKNKSIKIINFTRFLKYLSEENISKLFSKLDKKKYEKLYLCNNELSDEIFIKYICPFINNNKKLKELFVTFNKLTDKSCLHLFKILNTTRINTVSINENKILFKIPEFYKKIFINNNYIKKIKVCNYLDKYINYLIRIKKISNYEKFYWSIINNINIQNDFSQLISFEVIIDNLIKQKFKKRKLKLKNNSSKRSKNDN
jgi:hypothetical protein